MALLKHGCTIWTVSLVALFKTIHFLNDHTKIFVPSLLFCHMLASVCRHPFFCMLTV